MRKSTPLATTRFPVERLVLEYGPDGSAVLTVHLGPAAPPATAPLYAPTPDIDMPLPMAAEVHMGRGPSRRLLAAAAAVVAVVVVAGVATVNAGSGSAPAIEPLRNVPTSNVTLTPPPIRPMACRGDAPFSPGGCVPDPSKSVVSATEAVGCLFLIRTAAQALAVDPDTYARVLATRTDAGQTIDEAIGDHLGHARLFLGGQTENAAELDAAIAMASTSPCAAEADRFYPSNAA